MYEVFKERECQSVVPSGSFNITDFRGVCTSIQKFFYFFQGKSEEKSFTYPDVLKIKGLAGWRGGIIIPTGNFWRKALQIQVKPTLFKKA